MKQGLKHRQRKNAGGIGVIDIHNVYGTTPKND